MSTGRSLSFLLLFRWRPRYHTKAPPRGEGEDELCGGAGGSGRGEGGPPGAGRSPLPHSPPPSQHAGRLSAPPHAGDPPLPG